MTPDALTDAVGDAAALAASQLSTATEKLRDQIDTMDTEAMPVLADVLAAMGAAHTVCVLVARAIRPTPGTTDPKETA